MTEALTDRRYSPQCLYADSAYEYEEYMKPSEILNKIYCVLVHIEKIWYNKCRAFIIRTYITRHDGRFCEPDDVVLFINYPS